MPSQTITDIQTPVGRQSVMDETARAVRSVLVGADGTAGAVAIDQTTPGTTNAVVPVPSAAAAAGSLYYEYTAGLSPREVIKATPGRLLKLHGSNKNPAVRWLQFFDRTTAPAPGAVATQNWEIPAGSSTAPGYVEWEFKYGPRFANGIAWAISTTQGVFTAATPSEHNMHAEYI